MATRSRPHRADPQRGGGHHDHEHGPEREHEHWTSSGPFALMRQGIDEMDRWFSRLSRSSPSWMPSVQRAGDWMPALEAFQRGSEFVIRLEVPGMTRTDLHVEAGDDAITIRGERKQEQREEAEGLFWTERSYGSFSRTIPLPPGTIADSAKATFTNGVLEVVMQAPSPEARRGRRIDISGA
jgi:HSP20 family protein